MKRRLIIFFVLSMIGFASCNTSQNKENQSNNELTLNFPYKLYPTENMWTFIKLDTRNGRMWQVQYSVKGSEYRFETTLNEEKLANDSIPGRFELYPTQNIYNFVLLDRINGYAWQVQWSMDVDNRAILPIN